MNLVWFLITATLTLTVMTSIAVVSFRAGRSKGFGEIFHIRIEAAQARRQMHDLTRKAFVAMTEEADNGNARRINNDH